MGHPLKPFVCEKETNLGALKLLSPSPELDTLSGRKEWHSIIWMHVVFKRGQRERFGVREMPLRYLHCHDPGLKKAWQIPLPVCDCRAS